MFCFVAFISKKLRKPLSEPKLIKRFHYFHKEKRHKQSLNNDVAACYQVCSQLNAACVSLPNIYNVKQLWK